MDAFKQLYDKYKKEIYIYLYYLSGDPHVAEDLTQETFVGAFKSIRKFRGESKVSTWLYQIAKYTFYDFLRKKQKEQEKIDDYIAESELVDFRTPESTYVQNESAKVLCEAIQQLPQPKQHLVILRLCSQLSYKAIGEIFEQTEVWARVNFYRAKKDLGAILESEANDNEKEV